MKAILYFSLCLITVFMAIPASVSADELNWTSGQFVLGSEEDIGHTLDLKSSVNGNFHLAISNDYHGSIWYGKWEEPTWSIMEQAVFVDSDAYFAPELGLWGEFPIIMYNNSMTGNLNSVMRTGSSWTDPEVVSGATHVNKFQMAVDTYGVRHIIYLRIDSLGQELIYATDLSGSWEHEQIAFYDRGIIVHHMAIALDSDGRPHFVWAVRDARTINYAVRTGPATFETEVVTSGVWCLWMDMVMLDGDFPYLAFVDAPSNYMIKERFKIGSEFYGGIVADVPGTSVIYDVGMAVAVEEGITVSNLYYVYSRPEGLFYAHYDSGWRSEPIESVYLGGICIELSAQWDGTRDAVGLAVRDHSDSTIYFALGYLPSDPTATPDPAGTPTPTPSPDPAGSPTPTPTPLPTMDIALDLGSDRNYEAGDLMACYLRVQNFGGARDADIYVLLEVFGEFWFAPTWTHDIDWYEITLAEADLFWIEYIPEFFLPDPLSSGGPFYFYAAAFSPGTLEADTIISNIETKEFNFI